MGDSPSELKEADYKVSFAADCQQLCSATVFSFEFRCRLPAAKFADLSDAVEAQADRPLSSTTPLPLRSVKYTIEAVRVRGASCSGLRANSVHTKQTKGCEKAVLETLKID